MAEWFYQMMGEEFGPFSSEDLQTLAIEGTLQGDTYVKKGHDGKWVTADCVKGLFDHSTNSSTSITSVNERFDSAAPVDRAADKQRSGQIETSITKTNADAAALLIDGGKRVQFNCASCGHITKVENERAGTRHKCLVCNNWMSIPTPTAEAAAPESSTKEIVFQLSFFRLSNDVRQLPNDIRQFFDDMRQYVPIARREAQYTVKTKSGDVITAQVGGIRTMILKGELGRESQVRKFDSDENDWHTIGQRLSKELFDIHVLYDPVGAYATLGTLIVAPLIVVAYAVLLTPAREGLTSSQLSPFVGVLVAVLLGLLYAVLFAVFVILMFKLVFNLMLVVSQGDAIRFGKMLFVFSPVVFPFVVGVLVWLLLVIVPSIVCGGGVGALYGFLRKHSIPRAPD